MKQKINIAPLKSIERMQLIQQKDAHLQNFALLKREKSDYVNASKLSAGEKIVLVFDLEKVFETPKLT